MSVTFFTKNLFTLNGFIPIKNLARHVGMQVGQWHDFPVLNFTSSFGIKVDTDILEDNIVVPDISTEDCCGVICLQHVKVQDFDVDLIGTHTFLNSVVDINIVHVIDEDTMLLCIEGSSTSFDALKNYITEIMSKMEVIKFE